MDPWERHRLTEGERADFERDGFLTLPGALDAETQRALVALATAHDDAYRARPDIGPAHVLNRHDLVQADDAFLAVVDNPRVFPKVFDVLGWNIQLFHTQLIVTPPAPPGAPSHPYGWHQDNNRMNLDFETPPPHPRVSVKVGYFLTDVSGSGMGNLWIVPGSHGHGRPAGDARPDGAVELRARAGDAVLFDRRLWHAASTNTSDQTRIFLTYGYAYRWLRPKSAMHLESLWDGCDPIRRQLLGAAPSGPNGYFDPQDDDVPLRAYLTGASTSSRAGGR